MKESGKDFALCHCLIINGADYYEARRLLCWDEYTKSAKPEKGITT